MSIQVQEALTIYEELGLPTLQLEALEAMAVACKAWRHPVGELYQYSPITMASWPLGYDI